MKFVLKCGISGIVMVTNSIYPVISCWEGGQILTEPPYRTGNDHEKKSLSEDTLNIV